MDTTLIINPGSASKKYALYRGDAEILSVSFEHTEKGFGKCVEVNGKRQRCEETTAVAYTNALDEMLTIAIHEGAIKEESTDITHIGVRIVAPGTYFTMHRRIDAPYLKTLEQFIEVAPLHIPHMLEEIRGAMSRFPDVPVMGISDSAFHETMAPYAREYSIPKEDREALDLHRFGYHGISVASCIPRVAHVLGTHPERMIVCHVGSGVSVTALKDGESFDTTMGFGPGSGLMMGTRAGELDPSALLYLMQKKHFSAQETEYYVNEQCGLRGMLGENDLRIALHRTERGNHDAENAVALFFYGIRKAIGAFAVALGGLDALVFTATAAERNSIVRARICEGLALVGVHLDAEANDSLGAREGLISHKESTAKVVVVHTHEMAEIARIVNTFA